ncbi:MAG: hypothetical protein ACE5I1_09345, partial [bacterium]
NVHVDLPFCYDDMKNNTILKTPEHALQARESHNSSKNDLAEKLSGYSLLMKILDSLDFGINIMEKVTSWKRLGMLWYLDA